MKKMNLFVKSTISMLLIMITMVAFSQKLPNVVILATGGTIAGAARRR